jgi:hypothetical protein
MSSDTTTSPLSVFSKTIDSVYPDFDSLDINDTLMYGGVSLLVVFLGVLMYLYRDVFLEKLQYYTLQMYLGKPNEIHSTEIPKSAVSEPDVDNDSDDEPEADI